MKALTLHRPWTELVLVGGKSIENRPWNTKHRGSLLIHGGKTYDNRALGISVGAGLVIDFDADHGPNLSIEAPTGLVGIVDVIGVCSRSAGRDRVICECGPWAFPGQYHWHLAEPRRLPEPIPCRGFQQLWTPPDDVLALIPEATRATEDALFGFAAPEATP